ncbi:unnamed protein product, partial [Tetraodon nigroviridis]
SVHKLRPGDIKVVAAVGDSLTVRNGIAASPNNILDVLTQYRGLSWSIGGEGNLTSVTTLPSEFSSSLQLGSNNKSRSIVIIFVVTDILKHFNPNVTGYSSGIGKQDTPQAFLNQAVAGAKTKDLTPQIRALVTRMKNTSGINFELDWKLITVFIGGNDICDHCQNSLLYSAENYVRHIQDNLDYLHKEVKHTCLIAYALLRYVFSLLWPNVFTFVKVPRALVNLVEPLYISPLRELHMDPSLKCPTLLLKFLCPCVILPKSNSEAFQKLEEMNRKYQLVLRNLVESSRYDTREDFTVVVQPFFREIIVPRTPDGRPDRSFFSADCFHLSQRAQTLMARSLWNNMNWGSDFSCVNLAPSETVPTSGLYCMKHVCSLFRSSAQAPKPETCWSSTESTRVYHGDILKKFNQFLKGFSRDKIPKQNGFNMAVDGAKASYVQYV